MALVCDGMLEIVVQAVDQALCRKCTVHGMFVVMLCSKITEMFSKRLIWPNAGSVR